MLELLDLLEVLRLLEMLELLQMLGLLEVLGLLLPSHGFEPANHASHDCESCEPTWLAMRVNMRVTQLLKANRFKMGA